MGTKRGATRRDERLLESKTSVCRLLFGLFLDAGVPTVHLRFTRNLLSSRTKSAAGGGAVDDSFLDEFSDGGVKPLETDMKLAAQPLLRFRFVVSGEALDDLSLQIGQVAGPRRRADDLEMRRRRRVSAKRQLNRLAGRCVPLLHGQLECGTPTFQIEVALTPGVKIS